MRLGQAETTIEAQSGLSEAKTDVRARARMHRTTGRAAKLAAQSGREQLGQWKSAAVELRDSGDGGGRTGRFRASLGGGNVN